MEERIGGSSDRGRDRGIRFSSTAMLMLLGLSLLLAGCASTAGSERPIFVTARYDANGDGQFLGQEDMFVIYALTLDRDEVNVTRISDPAFWHMGSNVSPTGDRMAYTSGRQDTDGNGVVDMSDEVGVYTADLDGGSEVEIFRAAGITAGMWSRDGAQLAVQYGQQNEWLVVNADGTGERRITHEEFMATDSTAFDPSFSPDGSLRVGMTQQTGWFVTDVDLPPARLEDVVPLTDELSDYTFLAWSPDSKHLLLAVQEEADSATAVELSLTLFVINADGTGLTQVSSQGGSSRLVKWSPDGQQIAFLTWWEDTDGDGITDRERDPDDPVLYVVNIDGSEGRRLLTDEYRLALAFGW